MDIFVYVLGGIILGSLLAAFLTWFILSKNKNKPEDDQSFIMLQNQLEALRKTIDSRIGESQRDMRDAVQTQFSESQKLIREINKQVTEQLLTVTRGVTEVSEANKQVFTIAEQLQNLEKVLKHQKQRGNLGEASLELILSNILPPGAYKMQYMFKDKDKVDAIIETKEGIIPIDAKFSLDNYNRIINETNDERRAELEKEFKNDLKKRIDETAKYIKPKEGTLPFAFMFIPAEGIYYDLLVNEVGASKTNSRNLIDYAYHEKSVIIVSPTTFSAYLQSVLYGFKAFKIEESAKEIRDKVEKLMRHIASYDDYYKKLGNSLQTTVNHYNNGYKELGKIDKDILRITDSSAGIEPLALDRPKLED